MAKSKSIKQVSIASNESWDLCGTKEQANEICDALLGCAIKKLSFVVRWPWLTGPFQRLLSKTTTEEIVFCSFVKKFVKIASTFFGFIHFIAFLD